jgi:hypothetical protein
LSSAAGGLAAALGGAALLGIPTYLSKEVGFFGPESNWARLAAFEGFVVGLFPGIIIGLVIGLLRPHPLIGAFIGVGVGFLIMFVFLAMGLSPDLDQEIFSMLLVSIPICAVIALIIALVNRPPRISLPDEPLDRDTGRVFTNLTD